MSSIPKPVLGALLILLGIAGISGCASKDAEVASLKRLLAAQRERIDELRLSKADMQRVIDLKTADVAREKQARLQAEHERDLRPLVVSGDGVRLASQAQANSDAARARSTAGAMSRSASRDARATSAIVRQTQHALKEAYYYHGPLNGVYGPQTRRALAAYQRAKGLANGGLTFETLRSLGLQPPEPSITADIR